MTRQKPRHPQTTTIAQLADQAQLAHLDTGKPGICMDHEKQYQMAKALQSSGQFSILDCLAIAVCIQHCLDHCIDDPAFIIESGTMVVDALRELSVADCSIPPEPINQSDRYKQIGRD